ncbi:putative major capsid protein [Yellowstone lake phycodnavirus 2]|uniref:putative major capsid protein n=1 Tax=Yellowstone lake phycodnavirus 2 TaxID=1586714 RepID=UPI0006EBC36E|nr:putative major capsid protein [Yellowstone lake phycodnavirus 2]BAT22296.1 putative major capsid protein [Yellowstone lake phycodnavirus 2]
MAGRATLAYLGADDVMLVGEPEITYFLEKYSAPIPFAKRLDVISFDTQVKFGGESVVQIPKRGEMISNLYLKFTTPQLNSALCDSAMTYMIDYVELYCNGQLVERLYGEYIEMMNDLKTPQGKQATLQYLTGKVYPATSATLNQVYTIPLPFTSLRKGFEIDNAYLEFRVVLRNSREFTINPVTLWTEPLNIQLLVEYVYINVKIKRDVQVYEQVQRVEFIAPVGVNNVRLQLGLMNPVKEFFVVIQNSGAFGFDFTTNGTFSLDGNSYTNGTTEQLSNLVLKFNNVERISKDIGTPLFLRVIQPMEYHTRVPDRKFYMYSFSLDPENVIPTGQVNMSRISNQVMELSMVPSAQSRFIRIYAVSYNFIQKGKVLFNNLEEAGELRTFQGN